MSDDTHYDGPAPKKHLRNFTDLILDAPVGEELEIVAWVDRPPTEDILVGGTYAVVSPSKYVRAEILDGTMYGQYPNFDDDGWFVVLKLRIISIEVKRKLKRVT